jgi:hypothetical protein
VTSYLVLCGAALLLMGSLAKAEPATPAMRKEVPAAVEAELATREVLCELDSLGELVIPEGALTKADLNGDGAVEFIVTLCRLACAGSLPKVSTACDQSVIFISAGTGYQPAKMPGEILDIRQKPGRPAKILSSFISNRTTCPVADGVCNALYEVRQGELVQVGIE